MTGLRLGWIGVGNMGLPICRNLLKAGFALTVHDIDARRVAAAVADGARAAGGLTDLVAQSDVVFSMVPNDKVLLTLAAGDDGLAGLLGAGQVFVDLSTVSPASSAVVAEALRTCRAAYLRAPVSGSTTNAVNASLSIYCSGPRSAFDRCLPVLQAIGSRHTYAGEGEEARILKLLINMVVCITPAVVGEALSFGLRSGLQWDAMIDALNLSAAASPLIGYKAEMMKRRDWAPMAAVDLTAKDLDLALDWGRKRHVPMPFSALAQQINSGYQASGDGQLDFFSVVTWPERLTRHDGSGE